MKYVAIGLGALSAILTALIWISGKLLDKVIKEALERRDYE